MLFVMLRVQGDLKIEIGKKDTPSIAWLLSNDEQIIGEMWVSPYGVEDKLLDILSATSYTVDMRMYQLTSDEVMSTLKNLWFLGVDIDMVLENETFGWSSKEYDAVVKKLDPVGADIVTDEPLGTNFVHAKVLLLDASTYIISTANLSYSSFWRNRDYWFIGEQPEIAASLSNIFTKDHAGQALSYDDVHPALLVCPLDCRKKITDAIWKAERFIWIEAQYIQDEGIVATLRKKQLDGVDVRIMVGEYQDEGWLETFGTGVRMYDDYYLHAKNILIDGEILVMWSMNLSSNALDNNREIGIMIDDDEVVEQFGEQFERDWEAATIFHS